MHRQRNPPAKPPERGSFPLDHLRECDETVKAYNECMKKAKGLNRVCKPLSKKYLECRMKTELMATDDLTNLGFKESYNVNESGEDIDAIKAGWVGKYDQAKEKTGFVAGLSGYATDAKYEKSE